MLCTVPVFAANGLALTFSNIGFVGAVFAALTGWCAGLAIAKHPLLAQMRLALNRLPFGRYLLSSPQRSTEVAQVQQ